MKLINFFTLLCLIILNACSKQIDQTPNSPDRKLTKVFVIDTTRQSPHDTLERISINYNSGGKLLSFLKIVSDTVGNIEKYKSTRYEYFPNSNLVQLSVLKDSSIYPLQYLRYDSTWYSYDNNKKCIKDSLAHGLYYNTMNYIRSGNHISSNWYGATHGVPNSTQYYYTRSAHLNDAGFIKTQTDTLHIPYEEQRIATTYYLGNPNPFFLLNGSIDKQMTVWEYGIESDQSDTRLFTFREVKGSWCPNTLCTGYVFNYIYEFWPDGNLKMAKEFKTRFFNSGTLVTTEHKKYYFIYE
ncbi:MAG: hypothetical protein ABIW38_04445 [Ferruginibacter sp.]